ncbi:MAG: hypothetical protein H0V55_03290 [Thermoleophilaceae bacterium]|nr:hypothetical protein [Thermoleophilaceae bacterium]
MEASGDSRARRVDIGFWGTQVLSLRMTEKAYEDLREALSSSEGRTFKQVETDEAVFSIDLDKVVYLRLESDREHIGF